MITYDDKDIGLIHDLVTMAREYAAPNINDYFEQYRADLIRAKLDMIEKILNEGVYEHESVEREN